METIGVRLLEPAEGPQHRTRGRGSHLRASQVSKLSGKKQTTQSEGGQEARRGTSVEGGPRTADEPRCRHRRRAPMPSATAKQGPRRAVAAHPRNGCDTSRRPPDAGGLASSGHWRHERKVAVSSPKHTPTGSQLQPGPPSSPRPRHSLTGDPHAADVPRRVRVKQRGEPLGGTQTLGGRGHGLLGHVTAAQEGVMWCRKTA